MKLREKYGDVVPENGPIPGAPARQHLGAGLVEHLSARRAAERRRRLLADRHPEAAQDERRSTWCAPASASTRRSASTPLPKTFWERSLFVRPRDREVVCHASAWDIDLEADVRIKMCIEPTAEDFTTIHHELGHNFYQRAYKKQPVIFRDSANDGFHEADRRHDRAVGHAGVPGEDRPARQGARRVARHRPADDARRSRRSRSCRSAC